jgi:hypothetical protein
VRVRNPVTKPPRRAHYPTTLRDDERGPRTRRRDHGPLSAPSLAPWEVSVAFAFVEVVALVEIGIALSRSTGGGSAPGDGLMFSVAVFPFAAGAAFAFAALSARINRPLRLPQWALPVPGRRARRFVWAALLLYPLLRWDGLAALAVALVWGLLLLSVLYADLLFGRPIHLGDPRRAADRQGGAVE